jgi:hypothetical protein
LSIRKVHHRKAIKKHGEKGFFPDLIKGNIDRNPSLFLEVDQQGFGFYGVPTL